MGGLRNSPSSSVRFKELDLLFWSNWFFLRKQTWIFTKDFFAEGDISNYVSFDKWSHLPSSEVHIWNIYWHTHWHMYTVVWNRWSRVQFHICINFYCMIVSLSYCMIVSLCYCMIVSLCYCLILSLRPNLIKLLGAYLSA
jgi:hypothetical protein